MAAAVFWVPGRVFPAHHGIPTAVLIKAYEYLIESRVNLRLDLITAISDRRSSQRTQELESKKDEYQIFIETTIVAFLGIDTSDNATYETFKPRLPLDDPGWSR